MRAETAGLERAAMDAVARSVACVTGPIGLSRVFDLGVCFAYRGVRVCCLRQRLVRFALPSCAAVSWEISYSFYVTHGIVLFCLSHAVNTVVPIRSFGPLEFWLFAGFCGICAISLAAFLYRKVELPFMTRQRASFSAHQTFFQLRSEFQHTAE